MLSRERRRVELKIKNKKIILLVLAMLFLFSSIVGSFYQIAIADEYEHEEEWKIDDKVKQDPTKADREANEKKDKFLEALEKEGYSGDIEDYGKKLNTEKFLTTKTDDVHWYMQYIFGPSHYMEDVNKGVKVEGEGEYLDENLFHEVNGRKTACYWDSENQDLLNHNCDVPSFGTELFQSIFRSRYPTGVKGGQKTAAKTNFGIPAGLSKSGVPVEANARGSKFSALELYGYDLPYTVYNGEWDDIQVSTSARLLSNVGFFSKVRILGAGIWNGAMNLLNLVAGGFSFNPLKWFKKGPGFVGGLVSTVVDSSDMYVIGTRQWKRPFFTDTLYNAYYMSDMDIINKSQEDLKMYLVQEFFKKARSHPRLNKVIRFAPVYNEGLYDGDGLQWGEDEHFPRFDYMSYRICLEYEVDDDGFETGACAVWETEDQTFARWKTAEPQVKYDEAANREGLVQTCFPDSDSYEELKKCWVEPWYDYSKPEMHFNNLVVKQIMDMLIQSYFLDNPKYDPTQQISHYVQANEQGVPLGGWENKSSWKYLYDSVDSTGGKLAAGAKPVRPSIKGAMFGNGEKTESTDDRYLHFLKTKESPIGNTSFAANTFRSISQFMIKITNELISFSYDNIVSKLKLDIIVNKTVEKMTDGIFFPLAIIMAAITAVFTIAKFGRYPRAGLNSIAWLIIVFMIAVALLSNPGKIIQTIEEVPTQIDNFLADVILFNADNNSELCSTTGKSSSIRSVQCTVWQLGIFTPWLEGQWGVTDYKKLDSSNFNNSNRELVGDATVDMGGGVTEKNWALYQLENMKSGTITTDDPKDLEGVSSKALYRIVDLQVGPNHSAQSDGKYFSSWSGMNSDYRNEIQLLSILVSIMILLVIGAFSIYKIEVTFLALIKLLFMPIYMLKSMGPNSKMKIIQYAGEWFALFIRRIFIGLFMLITLAVFQAMTRVNTPYTIMSIFLIIFMLLIRIYFRELLDIVAATSNKIEGQIGNYKKRAGEVNALPISARQLLSRKSRGLKEGVIGAATGAVIGAAYKIGNNAKGLNDDSKVMDAVKRGWEVGHDRGTLVEERKARKAGYGMLMNMARSSEAAKRKQSTKMELADFKEDTIEDTINSRINLRITAKMNRKSHLEYKLSEGWSSDEEEKVQKTIDEINQINKEIEELKETQYRLSNYKKQKSGNVPFADIAAKYNKYYIASQNTDRMEAIYNALLESKAKDIDNRYSNISSENFNQNDFNNDIDKSIDEMLIWNSNYNSMSGDFEAPKEGTFAKVKRRVKEEAKIKSFNINENLKSDTQVVTEEYREDLYNYYSNLIKDSKVKDEDVELWATKKNIEKAAKENKSKLEITKKQMLLNALSADLETELQDKDNIFEYNVKEELYEEQDSVDKVEVKKPIVINRDFKQEFKETENVAEIINQTKNESSDNIEEVKTKKSEEIKEKFNKIKEDKKKNLIEQLEENEVIDNSANIILNKDEDKTVKKDKIVQQLEKEQEKIDEAKKEPIIIDNEPKLKQEDNNMPKDNYRSVLIKRSEQKRLEMELELRKEISKDIEENAELTKSIIDSLNIKKEEEKPYNNKELTKEEKKEIIKKGMIIESILEKEGKLDKETKYQKPKVEDYIDRAQEIRDARKKQFKETVINNPIITREKPIKEEVAKENFIKKGNKKNKAERKSEIFEELDNEAKNSKHDKKNFDEKAENSNKYNKAKDKMSKNFLNKLNKAKNNNKESGNDE